MMNVGIGEAVRLRIIGLCEEHRISINKLCSIVTIKKLCDGLGISIVDFFNHSLFFELEQEVY